MSENISFKVLANACSGRLKRIAIVSKTTCVVVGVYKIGVRVADPANNTFSAVAVCSGLPPASLYVIDTE